MSFERYPYAVAAARLTPAARDNFALLVGWNSIPLSAINDLAARIAGKVARASARNPATSADT